MSIVEQIKNIDSIDFCGMLDGLVSHFESSWESASIADLSTLENTKFSNIVILGMGGSGSTGDIISAVYEDELEVPIQVCKTYTVPNYVNEKTLVFAVSYSGNTEETISAVLEAQKKGAFVIYISTGGKLLDIAKENNSIHIPLLDGLQPRAAFATLFPTIVCVLSRIGMIKFSKEDKDNFVSFLESRQKLFSSSNDSSTNTALEVAKKLIGKTPIIYGGDKFGGTAAYRIKCDFNENAKIHTFSHTYPELDHNEICAWDEAVVEENSKYMVLELRHSYEHERTSLRFEITNGIIAGANTISYIAVGESKLAQLVDMIYFGLWTSSYLAVLSNVDPGYIKNIVELKDRLSK